MQFDYFQKYIDKFRGYFDRYFAAIKRKILGQNNEQLDFLLDSFSKLTQNQKLGFILGGIGAAAVLVLGILIFYFGRINVLEADLNNSFDALHKFYNLKSSYQTEEANFTKLVQSVRSKTETLKVKPFFEETAQKLGVDLQGLSDQTVPMNTDNPLSSKMQFVKVDMRLPNISIPKLLSFLSEVEKSNNYLSVENLKINGKFGTKLFFDAQVRFRGYTVTGG